MPSPSLSNLLPGTVDGLVIAFAMPILLFPTGALALLVRRSSARPFIGEVPVVLRVPFLTDAMNSRLNRTFARLRAFLTHRFGRPTSTSSRGGPCRVRRFLTVQCGRPDFRVWSEFWRLRRAGLSCSKACNFTSSSAFHQALWRSIGLGPLAQMGARTGSQQMSDSKEHFYRATRQTRASSRRSKGTPNAHPAPH